MNWPPLESVYNDEYGPILVEVYTAAGMIWDKAEQLAILTFKDSQLGQRLLLRAAAVVSKKLSDPNNDLTDVKSYLYQTYKNMILDELRKENRRKRIVESHVNDISPPPVNIANHVERKILLEQIYRRMSPWLRQVYEWRCLGYDFDEISQELGVSANVIRSKYSKELNRLIKQIDKETRDTKRGL